MLPLARKTAQSLQNWLEPWLGEGFAIAPDEDALPALSEERLTRWKRIGEADFLSEAEKRRMVGLKDKPEGEDDE